jgi:hypothetical protein
MHSAKRKRGVRRSEFKLTHYAQRRTLAVLVYQQLGGAEGVGVIDHGVMATIVLLLVRASPGAVSALN